MAAGLRVSEFGAHQERTAILTGSLRDRSPLHCSGFFVGINFLDVKSLLRVQLDLVPR